MSRIGLFGGTFDPIHIGHTDIAEIVKEKLNLDKIIFIPAGNPPHKTDKDVTDKIDRFNMVKLATEKYDSFCVSDYEINKAERSYSVNLLKYFKEIYFEDELFFIIGGDSLYNLPAWWHYEELISLCSFVVVSRPDQYEKEHLLDKFSGKEKPFRAFFIDDIKIDISSTAIREKLKKGQNVQNMLHESVYGYIKDNRLYE